MTLLRYRVRLLLAVGLVLIVGLFAGGCISGPPGPGAIDGRVCCPNCPGAQIGGTLGIVPGEPDLPVGFNPCRAAHVTVAGAFGTIQAFTNERGYFMLNGVPAGYRKVTVSAHGYEVPATVKVDAGKKTMVGDGKWIQLADVYEP